MIFFCICIIILLILFDLRWFLSEKSRKERVVYVVLCGIVLLYAIQYAVGSEVFSPIRLLSQFTQDVLHLDYERWQGHS